jgi:PilZ domain-containing protein
VSDVQAPAPADATIDPRFPASAFPTITAVRLSPGDVVELVNMSKSGVLVEGRTRFVPGTRVTVVFEGGFTPPNARGKVVRCQVSSISGGALRYQSGIQFEKKFDALEPQVPAGAAPEPVAATKGSKAATTRAAEPAAAGPKRAINRW